MTLANKITMFRVICIPVFIVLMYLEDPAMKIAALVVYTLGSIMMTPQAKKAAKAAGRAVDISADDFEG